jgi:hypothetical protein
MLPHLSETVRCVVEGGGLQELGEGPGAVLAERLLPAPDRAWHPDPETARHALVEGNGLPGRGVDEGVGSESRGCGLAAVYGRDAPVAGAVDDHKATTADPAGVGLRDAEGGGRRHGGIHRVAPPLSRTCMPTCEAS